MDNRRIRRVCTALGLVLVSILVAALTLRTTSAHSQQSQPPQGPPDGRWKVVLTGRDLHFETTFQFDTLPDGTLDAAVVGPLGSFSLVFTDGRFDPAQNKLWLNAKTSYGPARFSGTLRGDTLAGHWTLTAKRIWFITLGTKGELRGQRNRTTARRTPPAPPLKVFDAVWQVVNQRFYDPRFAGTNWQEARTRLRPQAQAARTEAQLVNVLRTMLATLRSSHVDFYAQTAPATATSQGPQQRNPPVLSWRRLSASVGYLKIASFEETRPQALARLDQAFAELGGLPSLVIDLRGNRGGTLEMATRLGDYLFPTAQRVGYFVTRAGLAKQGVRSMDQMNLHSVPTYSGNDGHDFNRRLEQEGAVALVVGGKGKTPYRGRVVLLIDQECSSTTEAVAAAAKESHVATLIGRRSAGAMLGADVIAVGGGWLVQIPILDFRTAKSTRIEGVGVTPHISVKPTKAGKADADVERALKFLEHKQANRRANPTALGVTWPGAA